MDQFNLTRQAIVEIEKNNPKYARVLGQNMRGGVVASVTELRGSVSITTKRKRDYDTAAYQALYIFYPKYSSSEDVVDSYFKAAKRTLNIWKSQRRDIDELFESYLDDEFEPFDGVDITFYANDIPLTFLSINLRIGRDWFQYVFDIHYPAPKKFKLLNVRSGLKTDLEWPMGRNGNYVTYTELLKKGLVAAKPQYHVEDLYSLAEDMISVIP